MCIFKIIQNSNNFNSLINIQQTMRAKNTSNKLIVLS